MTQCMICGYGTVTSIGNNADELYVSLKAGISHISRLVLGKYSIPVSIVATKDFVSEREKLRCLSTAVVEEALKRAHLDLSHFNTERVGLVSATMSGTLNNIAEDFIAFKDAEKIDKQAIYRYNYNSITDYVYSYFKLQGPKITTSNTCSTGHVLIQQAVDFIKNGLCDICIVVGIDLVNPAALFPLLALRIIDLDIIKPFDLNRKGTMLGDGAGALVIESLESAKKRGAAIDAEIMGISIQNDVCGTEFGASSEGLTLAKTMREAVKQSSISLRQIDYINAHGTGTPQNDFVETKAIKEVFEEYSYEIPVSSTKSFVGHTGAAAGILGIIAGLFAIKYNMIHPTLHYKDRDPQCDLNYVPQKYLNKRVNYFLSNSVGVGGVNASIVISNHS